MRGKCSRKRRRRRKPLKTLDPIPRWLCLGQPCGFTGTGSTHKHPCWVTLLDPGGQYFTCPIKKLSRRIFKAYGLEPKPCWRESNEVQGKYGFFLVLFQNITCRIINTSYVPCVLYSRKYGSCASQSWSCDTLTLSLPDYFPCCARKKILLRNFGRKELL